MTALVRERLDAGADAMGSLNLVLIVGGCRR